VSYNLILGSREYSKSLAKKKKKKKKNMSPFSVLAARLGATPLQAAIPVVACGAMAVAASSKDQFTGSTTTTSFCEASTSSSSSSKQPSGRRALQIRRRMTKVGRFSVLSETADNPAVTVLILALSGKPMQPKDFINLYQSRKIDTKHERFRSTLDRGDLTHFITKEDFVPTVKEAIAYPVVYRRELKDWATDAVLQPMNLSESLWQAWTFTGGAIGQSGAFPKPKGMSAADKNRFDKDAVESLLLFRAHHCMADGVSFGAIFGDLADECEEINELVASKIRALKKRKRTWWQRFQIMLYYWGWGSIKSVAYQIYLYWQSLISHDPWKLLKAQPNMATIPRTMSWVQVAEVDEVKQVAEYFSQFSKGKVTVNDVFCSCVSAAVAKLMRFHQNRYPDLDLRLPYMNLVMPVHMQGGILLPGQSIGNKIGALISRIPAQEVDDPQERLNQVHTVLFERKQTPAAALSYLTAMAFGAVGVRMGGGLLPWLFEKAHANASAVVTNVRGSETAIHLDGRRVEASLGFLPLPAGIPIGVCVQSYNQKVTLTLVGESWAVPDADLFLSWVVEEYQTLLQQATQDQ
jgi:diacylglycerol O-acyltransferase